LDGITIIKKSLIMDKEIKKTSQEIIDMLCDRKGFDNWWYSLDDDIENEIISEIEKIIQNRLVSKKSNEGS
jgi:hypothetical protein